MADDPLIRSIRERRRVPEHFSLRGSQGRDAQKAWLDGFDCATALLRSGSTPQPETHESRSPDGDGQSAEWSAVGVASRDDVTTAVRGNEDGGVLATEGRVAESTPEQSAALRDASGRRVSPARPAGSTPADSHTNLRRAGSEPSPEKEQL